MRRLAVSASLGLTIALLAWPGRADASEGSLVKATATCRLVVEYANSVEAAGNRFAYFTVHNRSSHLCHLGRFPTVRLFDGKGRALTTYPHKRLFGTVQHPITALAPDQTGSFALIFFPQDGSGDFCRPVAHTATIRFGSTVTRVSLPTHLAKEHEPINPCRGQLSITQVNGS